MAGRSAWVAGNGVGLAWTTAINSADMASLANLNTVLSSVSDITNATSLDQFMQLSFSLTIASSTIVAGATISFYLYALNQNGTNYGDNQFVAGTASSKVSTITPCLAWVIPAVAATTTIMGDSLWAGPILIPPGSFRLAMQNASGFALTSGTQTVKYQTFNQNLNN